MQPPTPPLLAVNDLHVHFPVRSGLFGRSGEVVKAVDGIDLTVHAGRTLGLVGESGCGKSTLGRALVRLLEPSSGSIAFDGKPLSEPSGAALRRQRPEFQMIFQDPFASLNPAMTVFDLLAEPLLTHRRVQDRQELVRTVRELMATVGLAPRLLGKYPHEFSGGQRQRIGIARALALKPRLIICDEPVSALDVSVQAQVLNLLKDLQQQYDIAYVFIAHDLAAVRYIAGEIAVMYLGRIVERAPREQLIANPQHPYTQALLSAVPLPDPDAERSRKRIVLQGELPSPRQPPSGCSFHTRCPLAGPACRVERPVLRSTGTGAAVACLKAGQSLA